MVFIACRRSDGVHAREIERVMGYQPFKKGWGGRWYVDDENGAVYFTKPFYHGMHPDLRTANGFLIWEGRCFEIKWKSRVLPEKEGDRIVSIIGIDYDVLELPSDWSCEKLKKLEFLIKELIVVRWKVRDPKKRKRLVEVSLL